jgi:SAM-dependent methyltransferase
MVAGRRGYVKVGLLSTSLRRRKLDADLCEATGSLDGVVIDLGGENRQRRGGFRPRQYPGLRWISVNVNPAAHPEVVADVAEVPLADGCADTVICTEVLEHVRAPEQVLAESYRVLRPAGLLIASMPFLFRLHADPNDYQRFAPTKLKELLIETGFIGVDIRSQGFYFTVLADMIRGGLTQIKIRPLRWLLAVMILPLVYACLYVDNQSWVRRSHYFSSYSTGYFVTAIKG